MQVELHIVCSLRSRTYHDQHPPKSIVGVLVAIVAARERPVAFADAARVPVFLDVLIRPPMLDDASSTVNVLILAADRDTIMEWTVVRPERPAPIMTQSKPLAL